MKTPLLLSLISILTFCFCRHDLKIINCQSDLKDGLTSAEVCDSGPPVGPSEIFKTIEEYPIFPGCEGIADKIERRKCSDEKMIAFAQENLQYPPEALAAKLEGTVSISFVVETDGCIDLINVIKDIGCGCGEEAIRIVGLSPNWMPGKNQGTPKRVQMQVPVKFEL